MNIFITGKPRTGKTTLIQEIVDELDLEVGGMVCPEIRRQGSRRGFKIVNLATEERGILAHVDQEEGPKISKYRVNLEDLDQISQEAIELALKEKEVIVIDEIGKMELYSDVFSQEIDKALNSPQLVLAVLHRCYLDQFQDRGQVFKLEQENYSQVKRKVKEKIRENESGRN